ncbi:helix-turn-helix domain-containing protein [Spirillospora sp. CA-255316]
MLDRLAGVRALLSLFTVMTGSADEHQILRLTGSSVPEFARCRSLGVHLLGTGPGAGARADPDGPLEARLAALGEAGGSVAAVEEEWAWAYPLRSPAGTLGHLVVCAEAEPSAFEQFLLRALAQQTGIALDNARVHERERTLTEQLHAARAALSETAAELEQCRAFHDRLTGVATMGEGVEGIAHVLFELTGRPVAVEDRHGNLHAWAGPGRPDPYPKPSPEERERVLGRVAEAGAPVRHGGRLITTAGTRDGAFGVLALIDADGAAGPPEQAALKHAAAVLAVELAHLQSLVEVELRLGRDLVDDLLGGDGAGEEATVARARALGYDLHAVRRIVVVDCPGAPAGDALAQAVRRVVGRAGRGSLSVARGREVVVLSAAEGPWPRFRASVRRELGGRRCRVGVGGRCARPGDFPRSYREARLALAIQEAAGGGDGATEFDRLGVYRVLAGGGEPELVESFVQSWLGTLVDYDDRHGSELVTTLSRYLEHGGAYDATSRALSIHRSTLKYRLQRIRLLTGHDLSDPETRFSLELAARAWKTLAALRSVGR